MKRFDFDDKGFIIDGKRDFLVGGEIAQFRVDKSDLRRRMRIFKKAGGNALTTSVPWIIHEVEEGKILFNDTPYRDLKNFLITAKEEGLLVYVRPGPYVYTELTNGGIPKWLYKNYPEVKAKNINGESIEQASYMHPVFLEKYKKFLCALCKELKPYLTSNGGPVAVIQLDNEVAGIHTWSGTIDYNEQTMGFGKDGIYAKFIKSRYGKIENLNSSYQTDYKDFKEVDPRKIVADGKVKARIGKDYHDFYCYQLGLYVNTLKDYLREFGIDVPVSCNIANAYLLNYMPELIESMKNERFLIGFDCYYGLDVDWAVFNPSAKWFVKNIYAADMMRALGHPYTVLEMQAGTYVDVPPVLKEDLFAWYMMNLAIGMKGVSYYIISGGETPEALGNTSEVYDFQAPISSDGKVRENFKSLFKFGKVLNKNKWMLTSERVSSVQIGVEWQTMRGNGYACDANVPNTLSAEDVMIKYLSMALFSSPFTYNFINLKNGLDLSKPLIIVSPDTMSETAQKNVVDFIENGGKVLILCTLPTLNESFEPCTILKDYLGNVEFEKNTSVEPSVFVENERVYFVICQNKISKMPKGAEIYATDAEKDGVLGFKLNKGKGKVTFLSGFIKTANEKQIEVLERTLSELGAVPTVKCTNRTVYATFIKGEKKSAIFVMNFYTGVQKTKVYLFKDGKRKYIGNFKLKPLEVKMVKV